MQINALLKAKLTCLAGNPGKTLTAIEGVYLYRINKDERIECLSDPCIGIVVQGNKRAVIADEEYRYGEGWYVAYGMGLPAVSHITGASVERPHLALLIRLDLYILTELAAYVKPAPRQRIYKGVTIGEVTAELLEACLRLTNLLDTPERIPALAPMLIREIHYLLLTGPEGEDFRLLGSGKNPNSRIAEAVAWMRENYRQPFNLAELAAHVNMSLTSFSRHFRRITGTSPLQFQKRIRLYEAQRLMLTEGKSAETAAFAVGYESPTQFNREYKRQFSEPPRRNIEHSRLHQ